MNAWNPALTGYELTKNELPTNARQLTHNPSSSSNEIWNAQKEAMKFNALEAQKARNWQEKMYGSRYQMTMRDIKKAGLNPYILNQFSPGGFSSGSAAQIASNEHQNQNSYKPNALDFIGPMIAILGGILGINARFLIPKK